jgi:PAS domain S-box-containing protein
MAEIATLVDNAPDVLSRFGPDLRYLYINKAAEQATGIPREAFLGRTFRELGFPPEACALWEATLRQAFATGEAALIEFAIPLPPSGEIRHYEGRSVAERGPDGRVASVLTITRDVTDRVRALALLREGDERLRLAVESAAIGTWDYDLISGELRWDERCRAMFSVPADAAVDYSLFLESLHPEDRRRADAAVRRAVDPTGEGEFDAEFRIVGIADGARRWIRSKGRAFFDPGRTKAVRLIGTVIDITASKQAEEALRASEESLRKAADIFRLTDKPVVVGSEATRVIEMCNPAFARLYGYDAPEEMVGIPVVDVYAPAYRPLVADYIRRAHEQGHAVFQAEHLKRDGTVFPVEVDMTAVKDDEGRVLYRIVNITDITERRRTEAETERARERERNIAQHLQDALRPAAVGKMPGLEVGRVYRPALDEAEIGGDFYDVFPLDRNCYALVVADLSGKGLRAAAQIATVRHMLRTLLYLRHTTVAAAVTTLNELLSDHDLLSGFATLFVGVYDHDRRLLTYVNAGQEPGLIRRAADAREVEELGPTGAVLGGFPGAVFDEQTTPLRPGDVLALFTDGLTEAGRSRKDLLGMSGVTAVFQNSTEDRGGGPEEIAARIMAGVEEAATPAGIRDDVCLLVACIE